MKKITGHDRDWRDELRDLLESPIRAAGVRPTAEKIGLTGPPIHRWLAGHNAIGREKLEQLAELFGFRVVTKISKIKAE